MVYIIFYGIYYRNRRRIIMAFYKIGNVIRKRRIDLNLTQEELSFGICSVSTLSKIENGERYPNKKNFDALMQRLVDQ